MSGAAWPLGLAVVLLEELRVRRARAKRYASATSVPSKANAVKAVRFEPSVVDGECGERSEAAVGSAAMINSAVRCLRADIKDLRAEVRMLVSIGTVASRCPIYAGQARRIFQGLVSDRWHAFRSYLMRFQALPY